MTIIWICNNQWEDISLLRNLSRTNCSRSRLKLLRYHFQSLTIRKQLKAYNKERMLKKAKGLCQSILEGLWIKNSKRCSAKAKQLLTVIIIASKAHYTMSGESQWNWIKLLGSNKKNLASRQTLKMNTTMRKRTRPKWAHTTKRHFQDVRTSFQTLRQHNHSKLWQPGLKSKTVAN